MIEHSSTRPLNRGGGKLHSPIAAGMLAPLPYLGATLFLVDAVDLRLVLLLCSVADEFVLRAQPQSHRPSKRKLENQAWMQVWCHMQSRQSSFLILFPTLIFPTSPLPLPNPHPFSYIQQWCGSIDDSFRRNTHPPPLRCAQGRRNPVQRTSSTATLTCRRIHTTFDHTIILIL